MKINIGEFEFDNFHSLNDALQSSNPVFSLKHGRRFLFSKDDKSQAFRLNDLLKAVKQAALNSPLKQADKEGLDILCHTFHQLHMAGYEKELNEKDPLTQLITTIKHFFGKKTRKKLIGEIQKLAETKRNESSLPETEPVKPEKIPPEPLTLEAYQKKSHEIFTAHGIQPLEQDSWIRFQKGPLPPDTGHQNLWKLFINPKKDFFPEVLERSLNAFQDLPFLEGKISSNPFQPRKSKQMAIDDPCEPKLIFYFQGENSQEALRKAVERLELEFGEDVEILGAEVGERERPDGSKVKQYGPSFTKMRNPLLFYSQGGFTESGRNLLVQQAGKDLGKLDTLLKEKFEGENYYLIKGAKDPLEGFENDRAAKERLVGFYLSKKERPLARHLAEFEVKYQKIPSIEELATFLNRSPVTARAQLLGETYADVIEASLPEIQTIITKLKKKDLPRELLPSWDKLQSKSLKEWGASFTLFKLAATLPHLKEECAKLEEKIDQKVASHLKADSKDFFQWMVDFEREQKAQRWLGELGEESNRELDIQKTSQFFELAQSLPTESFTQPFTLFKLQNLLSKIEKLPEKEKILLKNSLENFAKNIVESMPLQGRHAFMKLYLMQESPFEGLKSILQNFSREKVEGNDPLKPTKESLAQLQKDLEAVEKGIDGAIEGAKRVQEGKGVVTFLEHLAAVMPKTFQRPLDSLILKHLQGEVVKETLYKEALKILELHPRFMNQTSKEKESAKNTLKEMVEEATLTVENGAIKPLYKTKGVLKETFDLTKASSWEPFFLFGGMLSTYYNLSEEEVSVIQKTWENKQSEVEEIALSLKRGFQVEMENIGASFIQEKVVEALQLYKEKVSHLKRRTQEQLDSKTPLLQRYFHAVPSMEIAQSILHTGIEATEARSGFGAFVSTAPELKYGSLVIGLPETIATSSKAATVFEKNPQVQIEREDVWAGLEKGISINPQEVELQKHLHKNLRAAIKKVADQQPSEKKEKEKIEAKLFQRFESSLTYRYEMLPGGKMGWQLYGRTFTAKGKPSSQFFKIDSEQQLEAAFETMATPSTRIPIVQNLDQASSSFAKEFLRLIREEPLLGNHHIGEDFSISSDLRDSPLPATLTAPDNEDLFKNHYQNLFAEKQLKDRGKMKFYTLSEAEKMCHEKGLEGKVTLIPLSEQLLEIELLLKQGRHVPREWKMKEPST